MTVDEQLLKNCIHCQYAISFFAKIAISQCVCMLEFELDLCETCLIDYINLVKSSNIQVITNQKRGC